MDKCGLSTQHGTCGYFTSTPFTGRYNGVMSQFHLIPPGPCDSFERFQSNMKMPLCLCWLVNWAIKLKLDVSLSVSVPVVPEFRFEKRCLFAITALAQQDTAYWHIGILTWVLFSLLLILLPLLVFLPSTFAFTSIVHSTISHQPFHSLTTSSHSSLVTHSHIPQHTHSWHPV